MPPDAKKWMEQEREKQKPIDEADPEDVRKRASSRIATLKHYIESAKKTIKDSEAELKFWEQIK